MEAPCQELTERGRCQNVVEDAAEVEDGMRGAEAEKKREEGVEQGWICGVDDVSLLLLL